MQIFNLIKKNYKFLIFIFLLSYLLRLFLFNLFLSKNENYITADSGAYKEFALKIAQINNIKDNFYRLPGYPVFLAIFYKLFNNQDKIALYIQIFLSSFIPILIFILSLIIFPNIILVAKLSALLSAINVGFNIFSGLLMSESLFIFLFLIFIILFFRTASCDCHPELVSGSRNIIHHNKNIFFAGLFLGFAGLVRPVGHYLLFLSILLIILNNLNFKNYKLNIKNNFKKILYLILGFTIITGPLLIKNYIYTGHLFFHTLPGKHFLYHSAANIVMKTENLDYGQAKQKLVILLNSEIKELENKKNITEIETCIIAEKIAYKYIFSHSIIFIKHAITNILKTAFRPFSEEFLFIQEKNNINNNLSNNINRYYLNLIPILNNKYLNLILIFELIYIFFIFIGFILFFINFIINKNIFNDINILSFIFLFIFLSLASGFARLRLPVEGLIIILVVRAYALGYIRCNLCLKKKHIF
ncbi:MAG: hypothetical protein SZ59_C0002G0278 [candidate division TM6 bacterium GW2011_GWF2_28_16]|nr:MAG: hypothetical protein SZ59_C0002G0278 [candidate division TM6 bacterium GW2011_GWF2_28_16]